MAPNTKPDRLEGDWVTDPCLAYLAFESSDELRAHLTKLHAFLLSPTAGPLGYLYQQQTRRVRELQKELNDVRER